MAWPVASQNCANTIRRSFRIELERLRRLQQRHVIDVDIAPRSASAHQYAGRLRAPFGRKMSGGEELFHLAELFGRGGHQAHADRPFGLLPQFVRVQRR